MTQEEKYSLHLPYRPKGKWVDLGADKRTKEGRGISCSIVGLSYFTHLKNPQIVVNDKSGLGYSNIEELTPYFRSFDQLTKECVQADYNGGKPFVPALELIKIQERYGKWVDIAPTIEYDYRIVNKPFGEMLKITKCDHWVLMLSFSEVERMPFYIIQQLLKWHFQVGFKKGEYVEVTNENNPYK